MPGWSPRERAERERFARAVEDEGFPLDDEELARQLSVVSALREIARDTGPDTAERLRIRARITDRLAAPEGKRRRPAVAAVWAGAFTLLVALGGLSLLLSKDALPGDALYGLKRAGESAALGLTFDDQAKALKQLEYAHGRLDELAELGSGGDHGAYTLALDDFDRDARAGVARLTALSVGSGGQQLGDLRTWAQRQASALAGARAAIPAAADGDYRESAVLLGRVADRVVALTNRLNCYRITSGESDDLGPLPAQGVCEPPVDPRHDLQPGAEEPAPIPTPTREPDRPELPAQQVTWAPPATTSGEPSESARPTPTSAPTTSSAAPTTVAPPIAATTGPRLPTMPPPPPPLISVPPLMTGVPGVGIG
ncbi:DUF5667 domain-containing protein [Amycolatopsis anabasis]|uniref:DUF5667 domain-containing protein n=1 Tax=Amycolatopsis anabasis TaxID=1840409 RepID=UPI001FE7729A|nr:DUF5667 domain-containing protein [Amycolatopsis anabasis]